MCHSKTQPLISETKGPNSTGTADINMKVIENLMEHQSLQLQQFV